VGRRRTSNRKKVTLCGAFARPAHDHPDLITDFVFDAADGCYRCLELSGTARPDRPMIHPWQNARLSYRGPALAPIIAPPGYSLSVRGAPRHLVRQVRLAQISIPPTTPTPN
jgi:hypothetical protein